MVPVGSFDAWSWLPCSFCNGFDTTHAQRVRFEAFSQMNYCGVVVCSSGLRDEATAPVNENTCKVFGGSPVTVHANFSGGAEFGLVATAQALQNSAAFLITAPVLCTRCVQESVSLNCVHPVPERRPHSSHDADARRWWAILQATGSTDRSMASRDR